MGARAGTGPCSALRNLSPRRIWTTGPLGWHRAGLWAGHASTVASAAVAAEILDTKGLRALPRRGAEDEP